MVKYYRRARDWAAILRGGRLVIAAEGSNRATVLIPGDDPIAACAAYCSVIRHLTE